MAVSNKCNRVRKPAEDIKRRAILANLRAKTGEILFSDKILWTIKADLAETIKIKGTIAPDKSDVITNPPKSA